LKKKNGLKKIEPNFFKFSVRRKRGSVAVKAVYEKERDQRMPDAQQIPFGELYKFHDSISVDCSLGLSS
jgi:hypothetical protein